MKKEVIVNAATLEEAKEIACSKLQVSNDDINDNKVTFEVLKEPKKKKFGVLGGSDAEIRASIEKEPIDEIYDYLMVILKGFNSECDFKVNCEREGHVVRFNILGDDINFLTVNHGEVIISIQRLLSAFSNNHFRKKGIRYKIFVNSGDYKQKKDESLKKFAVKMANKVLKEKKDINLDYMNSYQRRLVHSEVNKIDGVKSWSEGEGLKRHVIIGLDKDVKSDFDKGTDC